MRGARRGNQPINRWIQFYEYCTFDELPRLAVAAAVDAVRRCQVDGGFFGFSFLHHDDNVKYASFDGGMSTLVRHVGFNQIP